MTDRREFLAGAGAALAVSPGSAAAGVSGGGDAFLDEWQAETDLVRPEDFRRYMSGGGNPGGLAALDSLERAWEKAVAEIAAAKPGDVPAVWLIYNMGVVVKTRESLFSIDLVHRRAPELAPKLDFALISHNHGDHYTPAFYAAMNGSGKTVVNNFIDNYGAADWRKGGMYWATGGYTRGVKVFKIRDVEIRTSLCDHNQYLIDYTTAFEIRCGGWKMFHSGDCSSYEKLNPIWGSPDLWVQMPGCSFDNAAGEKKLKPRLTAFGHFAEMGHGKGRVTAKLVRDRAKKVVDAGGRVVVPRWGERIV